VNEKTDGDVGFFMGAGFCPRKCLKDSECNPSDVISAHEKTANDTAFQKKLLNDNRSHLQIRMILVNMPAVFITTKYLMLGNDLQGNDPS
jgi:hypothetical protein